MIKKSIDQLFYDEIYQTIESLGYDVYDYLPPLDSPYPFIHLGAVNLGVKDTKGLYIANVSITVNTWAQIENRALISDMQNEIFTAIKQLNINGHKIIFRSKEYQSQLMNDNSTGRDLWHGIQNFYFYI